jgi:hypothetical protein
VPPAFHQGSNVIITVAWEHVVPARITTSPSDLSPPWAGWATATERVREGTFDTINKLTVGIFGTLALGLLNETASNVALKL